MPDFQQAANALSRAEDDPAAMTQALVDFLPVSGASVSTIGDFLGTETLAASDGVIARIDELQFDLGEGPCWDALATLQPVIEPDLEGRPQHSWPAFSRALADHGVAAIFAFPLAVGPLRIGAIDLYAITPTPLGEERTTEATALASIISRHVLRDALRSAGSDGQGAAGPYSRRAVHQATGFVIAQCGISAEDAHLLMQGHAFAQGLSMDEIARDVISGRLTFTATGTTIGDSR
ncbi:GAF and ANTAR domain-containing protein [Lysobacter korlensis]|uniref:GAF and ANTAR domain-containing protein n=1 Tax=Lysobacter korlensis TaxID=553636 RepID=A0ABV6RUL2_9GAMM